MGTEKNMIRVMYIRIFKVNSFEYGTIVLWKILYYLLFVEFIIKSSGVLLPAGLISD